MSGKVEAYRAVLRGLDDWDTYLMAESGLPGPRGNLELARAAALEGNPERLARYRALSPDQAPVNSPQGFLAFCGVLGLGEQLAQGAMAALGELRKHAGDPRWRIREAVAMALQRWGEADLPALQAAMEAWAEGNLLERRAVVAALCEPALLREQAAARIALKILDRVTASLVAESDRRGEDFRVLRQALGYGWSVAAAADLPAGKQAMQAWFGSPDPDVRWVMKENLKKKRLERLDPAWVEHWFERYNSS
jgi:hypothetical protein